jgi:CRP-like cAMP-binding protein
MLKDLQNSFLGELNFEDRALLAAHLEIVELLPRERLEALGRTSAHLYFLENGIASVVGLSKGRRTRSEVALVGREGIVGVTAITGLAQSLTETTMLTNGRALRIARSDLTSVLSGRSSLEAAFLRYIYSLWLQTASTALVNAQGTIAQRLARWVLMATDRMHAGEIHVTHETISFLIGVRRASVTLVMHDFETEGLISTGRGHIKDCQSRGPRGGLRRILRHKRQRPGSAKL